MTGQGCALPQQNSRALRNFDKRSNIGRPIQFIIPFYAIINCDGCHIIAPNEMAYIRVVGATQSDGRTRNGPATKATHAGEQQRTRVSAICTQGASRARLDRHYEKQVQNGYPNTVTPDLAAYIAQLDTAFLATVSENGAPYIQHRGGPKGFIKVVDERTLGFADYRGNRQYITVGNLAGNDRAYLFLLDHANRQRIKVWGRARVVENDDALVAKLFDDGYRAKPERVILFTIDAWDVNCSQHITARFTQAEIAEASKMLIEKMAVLES